MMNISSEQSTAVKAIVPVHIQLTLISRLFRSMESTQIRIPKITETREPLDCS